MYFPEFFFISLCIVFFWFISFWEFNFFNLLLCLEISILYLICSTLNNENSNSVLMLSILVFGASETSVGLSLLVSLIRVNSLECLNANTCGSF